MNRSVSSIVWLAMAVAVPAASQTTARSWLDANERYLIGVADALWEMPEPAHREIRTSDHLQHELAKNGFEVETEIAGLPTAFIASYGSSPPVIGIVALLDALPGLSQAKLATERRPIEPGGAGHGCGHNLIGAADLGAVLAVKHAIAAEKLAGTIRFYGAPAEEIYHGGVYMVREGAFDDVDALLFWHPSAVTTAITRSGLAMDSVRFVFHGRASDATDAAAKGIDALEAAYRLAGLVAEESWPPGAVVNHVLHDGGTIPSIVTERASQWFFVHARDRDAVDALRERISGLARTAASETGTGLEVQRLSSTREWLINRELGELLHRELGEHEAPQYDNDEVTLAHALRREFSPEGDDAFFTGVLPLEFSDEPVPISDDTADASWVTPRGGFLVACFPAAVPSHSWQWAASASSSFAHQGMLRAARILTLVAMELITNPDSLHRVRREFEDAVRGRRYESPLPDGRGPFDYLRKQ